MMDMFKYMNHHRQNLFTSTTEEPSNSDTKRLLLHQVYSLAETQMKRYKYHPNFAKDLSLW